MAEMTYLEAINLGISEEMARDEKVVIFLLYRYHRKYRYRRSLYCR